MYRSVASCSLALLVVFGLGCSSGSSNEGSSAVGCRQKDDADNNSDCAAHAGKPRKLDCDSATQTNEAIGVGCVAQKPGDNDVCCPTSVSGQTEVKLPCTEPADTLTDSDCAGTAQPRKLDCTTSQQQQQGIGSGCRAEHPGDGADFDLCCPTNVRGGG